MKHTSYLLLGLLSIPALADTLSFRNDREGESYYAGNTYNREIHKTLREVEGKEIIALYRSTLGSMTDSNVCAYDVNRLMQKRLETLRPGFREMEGVIYYLRSQNEIDDVATKILLQAQKTVVTAVKSDETSRLPADKEKAGKMLALIKDFPTRFLANSCLDDAYRNLFGEINKLDKTGPASLSALISAAYQKRLISAETYTTLHQARQNGLENSGTSLRNYSQKLRSLRANRPVGFESSEFVTGKADKMKMSRRMRLMEYYNDFQIMLMADVVKKLRSRLEADRVDILVYRKEVLEETINLDPMERFRMAIRLLRKEMALLANNTYFNGRSPDYQDLMVASYEVGIIPAKELTEIAGIQDIWNPKKSFMEKAGTWIRSVASIATIALPPPFGFIPTLGIVVIEMTTKKNNNGDDITRLF